MLASELKNKLERLIETTKNDLPVVIRLDERSVGSHAHCEISSITNEIDWDSFALWICPSEKICRERKTKYFTKSMMIESFGGKLRYSCPTCEAFVKKTDKFCNSCGQSIVYNKDIEVHEWK